MTTVLDPTHRCLTGVDEHRVDADRLAATLAKRRAHLAAAAGHDPERVCRERCFPVLAVLAPVMTSRGGEVAYPGDPMCLYAALGVSVESANESVHAGLAGTTAYNDFVPAWGDPPDGDYRRRAARGERAEPSSTPDGSVFDPRVWDEESRERLVELVRRSCPRAVLISAVSAAFRQAIEIATHVRRLAPDALIVLGGRHADETIRYDAEAGVVHSARSSPLTVMREGLVPPVFDFVVSGQGAHALDALLRAIALALPSPTGQAEVGAVVKWLTELGAAGVEIPGSGVIAALDRGGEVISLPFGTSELSLQDLPSPYSAFPIRARFSVFKRRRDPSEACLTAHMMTIDTCPYGCSFCSEGRSVRGLPGGASGDVELALDRLCEAVHYQAEAGFFDDPVFWGGRFRAMVEFSQRLSELRADLAAGSGCDRRWISTPEDRERLLTFQWGAQLTVDLIVGSGPRGRERAREALRAMAGAGCTYVYIGIESMAEEVMDGVQKNLHRHSGVPWGERVRQALEEVRDAGIRAGSSVLFGLEGETEETIEETIEAIGRLIDEELLMLASPNVLTYHPGTEIAGAHADEAVDYHSPTPNRAPYTFFEEAYPGLVSRALDEGAIWRIHREADRRWGGSRNRTDLTADLAEAR